MSTKKYHMNLTVCRDKANTTKLQLPYLLIAQAENIDQFFVWHNYSDAADFFLSPDMTHRFNILHTQPSCNQRNEEWNYKNGK